MSYFVPEPVIDEWRRTHLPPVSVRCERGLHEGCPGNDALDGCSCCCHDADELEDMTGWDAEP